MWRTTHWSVWIKYHNLVCRLLTVHMARVTWLRHGGGAASAWLWGLLPHLLGEDQICLSNRQNDIREGGPADTVKIHRLEEQDESKVKLKVLWRSTLGICLSKTKKLRKCIIYMNERNKWSHSILGWSKCLNLGRPYVKSNKVAKRDSSKGITENNTRLQRGCLFRVGERKARERWTPSSWPQRASRAGRTSLCSLRGRPTLGKLQKETLWHSSPKTLLWSSKLSRNGCLGSWQALCSESVWSGTAWPLWKQDLSETFNIAPLPSQMAEFLPSDSPGLSDVSGSQKGALDPFSSLMLTCRVGKESILEWGEAPFKIQMAAAIPGPPHQKLRDWPRSAYCQEFYEWFWPHPWSTPLLQRASQAPPSTATAPTTGSVSIFSGQISRLTFRPHGQHPIAKFSPASPPPQAAVTLPNSSSPSGKYLKRPHGQNFMSLLDLIRTRGTPYSSSLCPSRISSPIKHNYLQFGSACSAHLSEVQPLSKAQVTHLLHKTWYRHNHSISSESRTF